jgi:hypothetical protein
VQRPGWRRLGARFRRPGIEQSSKLLVQAPFGYTEHEKAKGLPAPGPGPEKAPSGIDRGRFFRQGGHVINVAEEVETDGSAETSQCNVMMRIEPARNEEIYD